MIKIVNGNILDGTEDIIGQQVNCFGVMNAGLAKQIRIKYPEVYTSYKEICYDFVNIDRRTLLGQIHTILVSDGRVIANLFGQFNYGQDKRYTDYEALRESLDKLCRTAIKFNSSIALPYNIGCGLAGGEWDIVYKIIDKVFENYYVTLYRFDREA